MYVFWIVLIVVNGDINFFKGSFKDGGFEIVWNVKFFFVKVGIVGDVNYLCFVYKFIVNVNYGWIIESLVVIVFIEIEYEYYVMFFCELCEGIGCFVRYFFCEFCVFVVCWLLGIKLFKCEFSKVDYLCFVCDGCFCCL